ncbi:MAG: MFS transporter [Proteobacteria bacterium]|nr:MFS transporter [Pseudomonadota bacterium]
MSEAPDEIVVVEAIGPSLTLIPAASVIVLGSLALLMVGVMPALLGALADNGRLSAAGIGQCATLESLAMALGAGLSGAFLKTRHLRWIAGGASLALALLDFASMPASGENVLILRTLAGIPEGLLLWITVGMIARTETPERWAGYYWTALVAGQLLMALSFVYVIPHFGTEGGFAALGITALLGIAAATRAPDFYGDLPVNPDETGAPPLRGWWALFATLLYTSASGAVLVYLQPLSHEAGLSADVARTALWVSLAAQVVGGFLATVLAGRVHWFTVFCGSTVLYISGWFVMTLVAPAWLFIAANAWLGLVIVLVGPFLVPMTIEADPSRRTAMQSGPTQLMAGALGPLLSSFIVSDADVHGAVWLGVGLMLSGLALMGALHVTALRARKRLAAA